LRRDQPFVRWGRPWRYERRRRPRPVPADDRRPRWDGRESTVEYYRGIDGRINDALGGHETGDLLIRSVNFARIERFIREGAWDEAGAFLADAAADLDAGGTDFLVMATNTMHRVAPAIDEAIAIPLVHIVDVTAGAIREVGLETVGVLGTETTMVGAFYRDRFADHGIDVLVPDSGDRRDVDEIIFEELTHGVVREDSRETYLGVIDDLVAAGAEGIVLGCTEIERIVVWWQVPPEEPRSLDEQQVAVAGGVPGRSLRAEPPDVWRVDDPPAAVAVPEEGDAVFTLGPDGRFEHWSERLETTTGVGADDLARIDPLELFAPADRTAVREVIGRCLGEGEATVEATLQTTDCGQRDCDIRLLRSNDRYGSPAKIHGLLTFESSAASAGFGRSASRTPQMSD